MSGCCIEFKTIPLTYAATPASFKFAVSAVCSTLFSRPQARGTRAEPAPAEPAVGNSNHRSIIYKFNSHLTYRELRRFLTFKGNNRGAGRESRQHRAMCSFREGYDRATYIRPADFFEDRHRRSARFCSGIRPAARLCAGEGVEDRPHNGNAIDVPVLFRELRSHH